MDLKCQQLNAISLFSDDGNIYDSSNLFVSSAIVSTSVNRRAGIEAKASASSSVHLRLISLSSHEEASINGFHSFPTWHSARIL